MKIEEIHQMFKDQLLESGEMPPTLVFECAQSGLHIAALDGMPWERGSAKRLAFFLIGWEYGKKRVGDELRQVAFFGESWFNMSPDAEKMRKKPMPSEDPDRKEALLGMVITVDGANRSPSVLVNEMIRDGRGKLIDLLSRPVTNVSLPTGWLVAFIEGFENAAANTK